MYVRFYGLWTDGSGIIVATTLAMCCCFQLLLQNGYEGIEDVDYHGFVQLWLLLWKSIGWFC